METLAKPSVSPIIFHLAVVCQAAFGLQKKRNIVGIYELWQKII
jgi:hypothetical protein